MAKGIMERLAENVSVRLDSLIKSSEATVGTVTTTTTYVAEALPGTLAAAEKWRVKRIVEVTDSSDDSSETEIRWAGNAADFVHAADDLASLFA